MVAIAEVTGTDFRPHMKSLKVPVTQCMPPRSKTVLLTPGKADQARPGRGRCNSRQAGLLIAMAEQGNGFIEEVAWQAGRAAQTA